MISDFNANRTMVGAGNFAMDECAFEPGTQRGGDQEVIDAPADVPFARAAHGTPPGVMPAGFFKFAKRVDETSLHERVKPGAFLDGKAVVADIRLRIGQINLLVGDVEVTAEDDWFAAFELLEKMEKIAIPFLAIRQAGEVALGVRDVNIHQKEFRVFGGEHAAFVIVLAHADAAGDAERTLARKDDCAGITLFLRAIPIGGVGRGPELFDIIRHGLGFLQAKDVRRFVLEVIEKVFAQHGAKAVDVPRNDFHRIKLQELRTDGEQRWRAD